MRISGPLWKLRDLILAGMFMAIGVILPMSFHVFGGVGPKLLPMQFPVLLAGFFLCPQYAVAVGLLTPVISSFTTGMPPLFPVMPCLMVELASYALFLSVLKINNKYLKLLAALVLGKVVLLAFALSNPAFWGFATAQLTNGLWGMAWQIALVPIMVKAIELGGKYVRNN